MDRRGLPEGLLSGVLKQATPFDAHLLAVQIRPQDRRELEEVGNRPVLHTILFGILAGAPATSFWTPEGRLGGIVGVVPAGRGRGAIWMAATPVINELPVTFLRASRRYVEGLPYEILFNVVDARNEVHLRWLSWLGFTFIRRIEHYGPNRVPVYEFARINSDSV